MAVGRTNAGGGAKLTGNATPADVRAGATFYSDDPKNKQTGEADVLWIESGTVHVASMNVDYPVTFPNINKCFMLIVSQSSNTYAAGRLMLKDPFYGTWRSVVLGGGANAPSVIITETGFTVRNTQLSGYTHYWYAYEVL